MTAKVQTMLLAILLLFTLLLHRCEAAALKSVDITTSNEGATVVVSPTGHARIRENSLPMDTVRHLEGEEENTHKRSTTPYFPVLLATLIVNVVSLIALLSVIPVLMNTRPSFFKSVFWVANSHLQYFTETARGRSSRQIKADKNATGNISPPLTDILIPAYLCGVILATALFLVIPEAVLFIQRGTSSDRGEIEILPETIARFGAALMTGFMFPLLLGSLFPRSAEHICSDECVASSELTTVAYLKRDVYQKTVEEEDKDDEASVSTDIEGDINVKNPTKINLEPKYEKQEKHNINYRLAVSILTGGTTYNFFDGIFIGVAFLTCSKSTAICVTIITIYSEISQQVADYFLLTKCAGVSITRALLLIVAASLADIIGALIIVSLGIQELAIGIFLAFASGVYLHISASECLPRVYSVMKVSSKVSRDRWFALLFFIFGAFPIGLSLLHHGHCDE